MSTEVLAISDDETVECERLPSRVSHAELATALRNGKLAAIAVVVATQHGWLEASPLFALEVALALVQTQLTTSPALNVWLLTTGSPEHAGSCGLARSARAEASLPLVFMHSTATMALTLGLALTEPEAVLHKRKSRAPRLKTASPYLDGLVRLHFHARGAISNLFLEPLPTLRPLSDAEVLLRVRTVGLNFRDVLNVLGEYPGDPGPPGGDAAGVVREAPLLPHSTFGLGHAPLASLAIAATPFLANKPSTLSFEQACTLPVTWSTTHTAVERAGLCAGHAMVVQAAAGGVGLKAVEYAQWLHASTVGTAGRPHKHAQLRATGVNALCSSRDGAALTMGMTRHMVATRSHAVLNSLSLDFITASFASLGEGGAFEEIGKRGIWASDRHRASSTTTLYRAIALDADMALDPTWMGDVLALLASRAGVDALTSLRLQSFNMEAQHELAFRTLQSGLNTGKIVVRLVARTAGCYSVHVVTGGTGGLGLLTGRWLAQRGTRSLVLASRSGALAKDTGVEWEAMEASGVTPSLERCDTGEAVDIILLKARAPFLSGVWHAAGVLADAVLQNQDAPGVARVFAPKAYGAWSLHTAGSTSALDTVALFSSVAALLGGAGQANYAAANACLDALATSRHTHGVAAASVQWGAWAEVGMAARGAASERMAAMEAASGFSRIGLAQGLAALGMAVQHGSSAVLGMVPVTWSRFLGAGGVPAFLSAFASKAKSAGMASTGSASAACGVSLEAVLDMVKRTAGGSVDADAPLMEAGVDSLGAVELRNQLQGAAGGQSLPSTLVFDHPTARQLASLLQPKQSTGGAATSLGTPLVSTGGGVGIDGMSALLPSGASSPWMAICMVGCGYDAIMQVPAARWNVHAQMMLPEPIASRVRHTGFVRGAELADNAVFAVSPAEAAAMDPCQRLVLEFGYAALHDAPLDRTALGGSLTGFFLGFSGTEFAQVLRASPAGGSVYAATGSSASIAAGRLSYTLGLHGPCVSYDTACSAALAAGHAGLRALQLAECGVGLVVGVTLMLAPGVGTSFAVAGMTSARGRSHTFDERADGYARGEACGGVALRGGMNDGAALGLFGSAVRQDGRSASLTAPNGQAQQGLLVAALQDASTSVDTLALNEAHGTGTALGDPIEAGSLVGAVLSAREDTLAVGGVKANIGHAEPAAGMTGLLKLAVGLHEREAAPNAQLRLLNPHVSDTLHGVAGALAVQLAAVTRGSGGVPTGGVSSFGYSGTIAHAVLRRMPPCHKFGVVSSLQYRRRTFPWCQAHDTLSSSSTVTESLELRLAASWAAQCALDSALHSCAHSVLPTFVEVTVVGSGLAGLLLATTFAYARVDSLAVLEKSSSVGGTWRHHGNAFSRVNSSEPSYRLPLRMHKRANTNHTHHSEIIDDVLRLLMHHSLTPHIHTHAEVHRLACTPSGRWVLSGCRHAIMPIALQCTLAIMATNRRLGRPRRITLPSEEVWRGSMKRGLGGDVNSLYCANKRVLVLGMGAFAVENVRTSLERGATHVAIICRRRGTVCPQIVDWANFIRPFNSDVERGAPGDAVMMSHWQRAYDLSGATRPDCWKASGELKPDGHTVSTLDMYFIAHHVQKLTTKVGKVLRLEATAMVCTSDGEQLEASVLIKCVGFELHEGNERLLGRTQMRSFGMVERGLWLQIEAHLDARTFNSPFGSSYLLGASFNAVLIARYCNDCFLAAHLVHPKLHTSRINSITVSDTLQGSSELASIDPEVKVLLQAHLAATATAFNATMSPAEYTAENMRLWEAIHHTLSHALPSSARLAYPFAGLWEELPDVSVQAHQSSVRLSSLAALSFNEVLHAVNQVIGGSDLDADAPLMDAGLDSLGATELRSSLEAAAGAGLPATLVFEAPTARLIAEFLSADGAPVTCVWSGAESAERTVVVLRGCALQLPRCISSVGAAWHVAASAHDLLGEVPITRWVSSDPAIVAAALLGDRQECLRHGGFVNDVQRFDSRIFAISPAEAAASDPQQRLLLEHGYKALHATVLHTDAMDSRLGVYLGMEYYDFNQIVFDGPLQCSVLAANSGAMAAGRTSFVLGLHGPCALIGTTCSSGLVAVSCAYCALATAECAPAALAMAVSLILRPQGHVWHSRAGGLSRTGRCFTFDARADGFARSEAVMAGVIHTEGRGCTLASAVVRSDGRSASFTAPNGRAQRELLAAALTKADSVNCLVCYEAHGTGTALGDPTEVGSVAAVLLRSHSCRALQVGLCSIKGNTGHTEPGAGLTGLLLLSHALDAGLAPPNAQVRVLNESVQAAVCGLACCAGLEMTRLPEADTEMRAGGVSSFGINGTISHAIVRSLSHRAEPVVRPVLYRRRAFPWRDLPHPFAQHVQTVAEGSDIFWSSASGMLHALVADHVVQGRVIFPGAGYLEMALAAAWSGSALHGVFFLQPLAVEAAGLVVECSVAEGRFEVRSGEKGSATSDAAVHCSGAVVADHRGWQSISHTSVRASFSTRAVDVDVLYDGFNGVGLQYGPGYRTLVQAWSGVADAALARLHARSAQQGTRVHPADVDDALSVGALASGGSGMGDGEIQLPFAVDEAVLRSAEGPLWAV